MFKNADKELRQCWEVISSDITQERVQDSGIRWKFICPRASHWGGFYERLLKSVKTPLKRTLGKAILTEDEMRTTLAVVEAQKNSRPLTHCSDNTSDPLPLTQAKIIIGRPSQSITMKPEDIERSSSRKILLRCLKRSSNVG